MSGYGEPTVKFSLNVGPQDAGLYADSEPRMPASHSAIADYQKDCLDIIASTYTSSRWTFKTEKNCDHFERMWLRFRINALSATGASYLSLVDGFALFFIDRIELRNGTQIVQTIQPSYETFLRYVKEKTLEQRLKLFPQVGLGYTAAERNSRATRIQEFNLPLEFFWRDDIRKDPIVPAIANGLVVDVYLKSTAQVVNTDGTAVQFSLADIPVLRTELIHTPEATRADKVALVTGNRQVTYFYDELAQISPVTVPSGTTTSQEFRLDGLNGPLKTMWILVRPASAMSDNYANDYMSFDWAYNPSTVLVKSNQSQIVRPFNQRDFLQPSIDQRYFSGPPFPAICLCFSEDPESVTRATGHLNLTYASNPVIQLTWDTATTVDLRIDIVGFAYNWVQHQGGQFRKIFNP